MLVKRLQPIPVEAVVRGYLAGSGLEGIPATAPSAACPCRQGLEQRQQASARRSSPPPTKAAAGAHDENISYDQVVEVVGPRLAEQIRETSIALYETAAASRCPGA